MKKEIFFLSGLPRSGSTLLGSLLAQNPDISVTPTSPLLDLLCYTNEAFIKLDEKYTYDAQVVQGNVYTGIVDSFFENIKTKYVVDKHRGHPRNVVPLKKFVTKNPKIICTNRPIADVISSYISLIIKNQQDDNFVDNDLRNKKIQITTENRAKVLWESYISDPYMSMKFGLQNYREQIYVVNYDSLISNPSVELKNIYNHLGIDEFKNHQYENIQNKCAEQKDEAWGLRNLHEIRPKLQKTSKPSKEILGPYLTQYYNQFNLVIS